MIFSESWVHNFAHWAVLNFSIVSQNIDSGHRLTTTIKVKTTVLFLAFIQINKGIQKTIYIIIIMLGSTKPVQREQHGRPIYLKIWLAAYYTAFFLIQYFYYLRWLCGALCRNKTHYWNWKGYILVRAWNKSLV